MTTFDEEWAQLHAAAAARMRLNQFEDGGYHPGRQRALNVTPSLLKKRAGNAESVRGQFDKADDEVARETGQVPGSLKGFATDQALTAFLTRWRDQMAYARGLFTGTAKALRSAADAFDEEEKERTQAFRSGVSDFADTSGKKR